MNIKIIKQIIAGLANSKRYDRLLKTVNVLAVEKGKIEYEFKVEEEHLNGNGTLHGGMTATLVDTLSTFAIATTGDNKLGVSVDMSISYLKAAFPGETLKIKSEVYKTGKTLSFARVDIFNNNGDILVTGNHTKFIGGNN